jgi:hypothetical protein
MLVPVLVLLVLALASLLSVARCSCTCSRHHRRRHLVALTVPYQPARLVTTPPATPSQLGPPPSDSERPPGWTRYSNLRDKGDWVSGWVSRFSTGPQLLRLFSHFATLPQVATRHLGHCGTLSRSTAPPSTQSHVTCLAGSPEVTPHSTWFRWSVNPQSTLRTPPAISSSRPRGGGKVRTRPHRIQVLSRTPLPSNSGSLSLSLAQAQTHHLPINRFPPVATLTVSPGETRLASPRPPRPIASHRHVSGARRAQLTQRARRIRARTRA